MLLEQIILAISFHAIVHVNCNIKILDYSDSLQSRREHLQNSLQRREYLAWFGYFGI